MNDMTVNHFYMPKSEGELVSQPLVAATPSHESVNNFTDLMYSNRTNVQDQVLDSVLRQSSIIWTDRPEDLRRICSPEVEALVYRPSYNEALLEIADIVRQGYPHTRYGFRATVTTADHSQLDDLSKRGISSSLRAALIQDLSESANAVCSAFNVSRVALFLSTNKKPSSLLNTSNLSFHQDAKIYTSCNAQVIKVYGNSGTEFVAREHIISDEAYSSWINEVYELLQKGRDRRIFSLLPERFWDWIKKESPKTIATLLMQKHSRPNFLTQDGCIQELPAFALLFFYFSKQPDHPALLHRVNLPWVIGKRQPTGRMVAFFSPISD